jgi:hypothetical protein
MAYAQMERGNLLKKVKAHTGWARKQGHKLSRPMGMDSPGFKSLFGAVLERFSRGDVSRRQAAKKLNIGYAALLSLLDIRRKAV